MKLLVLSALLMANLSFAGTIRDLSVTTGAEGRNPQEALKQISDLCYYEYGGSIVGCPELIEAPANTKTDAEGNLIPFMTYDAKAKCGYH